MEETEIPHGTEAERIPRIMQQKVPGDNLAAG